MCLCPSSWPVGALRGWVSYKQRAGFGKGKRWDSEEWIPPKPGDLEAVWQMSGWLFPKPTGPFAYSESKIHKPSRSNSFTHIFWIELVPPAFMVQKQLLAFSFSSQFSFDSRCSGRLSSYPNIVLALAAMFEAYHNSLCTVAFLFPQEKKHICFSIAKVNTGMLAEKSRRKWPQSNTHRWPYSEIN